MAKKVQRSTKPSKPSDEPRACTVEGARALLSDETHEWIGAAVNTGDELAAVTAEILTALSAAVRTGDVEALRAKLGPERWAHAYNAARRHELYPLSPRRDVTARAFVRYVDSRRADPPEVIAQLAFMWLTTEGRVGGLVEGEGDQRRMLLELERAMNREGVDVYFGATGRITRAKAFAVALLRGWGLTHNQARDALKNADV